MIFEGALAHTRRPGGVDTVSGMNDAVTAQDLHRELGVHEHLVRSRLQEFFLEQGDLAEFDESADLTRAEADDFLAWHANRYGTTG